MAIRSLTARVLAVSTVWAVVALVVIGVVISALYRQGSERGFKDLLRAQLFNVVNSISVNEKTVLAGSPQLGDLRFSQPQTGWYWIVDPIGEFDTPPLISTSLGNAKLPIASVDEVPFDTGYVRFYTTKDPFGNEVEVAETEVVLDIQGHTARFRVAGNRDVLEADINRFTRNLTIALSIFGLGGLGMNALTILFGLRPLDQVRRSLEKIRAGESERLDGAFPREIQPLANEVNALIDSNRRIVERARMQVGNLAHSLKTPIAVLLNEARVLEASHGELVRNQVDAMQMQVQSYLSRARIAAQRESILARTEAQPALERLVRVMRKLNPEKEVHLSINPPGLVLAMELQDVEETVGNLLENAARHAKGEVWLNVRPATNEEHAKETGRQWIVLDVDDDGAGLDPDQIALAMKRGKRLDESKPGTGLGLSIVSEIVREYQGTLTLSRREEGGLRAELVLPAAV
ncbi:MULTISPECIES: HAMP domain-containing sensor histidine kinase [Ensifer]|jgi:signal transduction histidine kinase|uniref:histidine kinase n=1 Tax=Ensifer canadensis TaxID=555315 RepID=A0AAW4FT11_9HYPH|nr:MULTISPECIES: HAMP domain-containing sensor histidine kinase [Ensifer]MDP9627972.1 signal transduction histidine kinase [Ensifer adhaerens]KQU72145.1 histidine kinase [Ensifer sp. Root31]KQW44331.1 histidine kinase [Ensifer sp. Root1252]KQW84498.1 histidine kinase [Ensifer sp. Root127]KQY71781.1 histidine kinase [Ensifer sp. Root142]